MVKCENCDGSGVIPVKTLVVVPRCCGKYAHKGFCCGCPVPGTDEDWEPSMCIYCNGTGINKN